MKVYIHGNCQAPILHSMLGAAFPEWTISSYEVFGDPILHQFDHYRHLVHTADAIVAQPIWAGYRGVCELSTEWIARNKSAEARLITVPSLFFRGSHPAIFYLRDDAVEIPNVGMPYHDITLLYLMAKSCSKDRIVEAMCAPSLYSAGFLAAELAMALGELRRREDDDDLTVKVSGWLEARAMQRQLFHVINHPSREVMAFVANEVIAAFGGEPRVSIEGHDALGTPHIPAPPALLHQWGAAHSAGMDEFRVPGMARPLSRRDYYVRTVELMSARSPAALAALLARQQEAAGFLDRLKQDGIDRFL